jgi:hypothetical protein
MAKGFSKYQYRERQNENEAMEGCLKATIVVELYFERP